MPHVASADSERRYDLRHGACDLPFSLLEQRLVHHELIRRACDLLLRAAGESAGVIERMPSIRIPAVDGVEGGDARRAREGR